MGKHAASLAAVCYCINVNTCRRKGLPAYSKHKHNDHGVDSVLPRLAIALAASRQYSIESKPGPGDGKAAIGGPFKLINHEGKEITNEDLKEKRDSLQITPVFISIDPERDNVEQIREYVKEFHPRLVDLTGSLDEIRQVAQAYRVYYMKTEEDGSDYLVDHSVIMYLMDPKMEFVKFFGKNYDVNGLAGGIIDEIKRYK